MSSYVALAQGLVGADLPATVYRFFQSKVILHGTLQQYLSVPRACDAY